MSIFNPNRPMDSDIWLMDGAAITFGSSKSVPATPSSVPSNYDPNSTIVAIGCTIQYQRPITKRYPINVRRAIYLVGIPEGQITFQTLFGPGITIRDFIDKFNNVSEDDNATILVTPFSTSDYLMVSQNSTNNQGSWCITKPVLARVGLNISESQSADIQAVGEITMQFTEMDILNDDSGD